MIDHCRLEQFDCTLCHTHVDMRKPNATAYAIDGDWDKPICTACFQKRHARQRADERKARTDMTVREAFAMAAMQGLLAGRQSDGVADAVLLAQASLKVADRLIEEMNK